MLFRSTKVLKQEEHGLSVATGGGVVVGAKLSPLNNANIVATADHDKDIVSESGTFTESGGKKVAAAVTSATNAAAAAAAPLKPMVVLDQLKTREDKFLNNLLLHKKFSDIARKHKLEDVSIEVAALISQATQEYMRNLLEKLNVVAQHRLDMSMRTNDSYEMTNDVKSQIKFIEELDKLEKKKKDEAEREKLLKAAKSRSKGEDQELNKLKQKAKEVIQAESDELRRQDANKTALAAIGPRKKRKLEETGNNVNTTNTRTIFRPKIKRVSLKDLIFVMEQEKEFRRSTILYKALNK